MNYATVCSGIEAPTQAWHGLGWVPQFFSEIDPFPSAVLAHHYPDVPNYGDMTNYKDWPDHDLGLICGGTPCQAFSVAGLRKGLDDPRGNLTLTFLGIVDRYRPEWVVWENVPGVLSIDGGRTFGTFLGGLGQLGYGFCYRVLDAQYFGVAQRRRRVFVVGYLGDWHRAAAVLFERHSLSGHPAPRREAGKVAPCIPSRSLGGGGLGTDFDCDGGVITQPYEVANCLTQRMHKGINSTVDEGQTPVITHEVVGTLNHSGGHAVPGNCSQDWNAGMLLPVAFHENQRGEVSLNDTTGALNSGGGKPGQGYPAIAFSCKDHGADASEISPTLRSMNHDGSHASGGGQGAVAFTTKGNGECFEADVHPTLSVGGGQAGQGYPAARIGMQVRRLTPKECERLQGFPDNYSAIPWRNKPAEQCPDGPRYKALGNSMAVPVMKWIGERIALLTSLL